MTAPKSRSPWLSPDTKIGVATVFSQLALLIWTASKFSSRIEQGEKERAEMRTAISAMIETQAATNVKLMQIETKIEQADKDRDSTQAGIREILNRLK